jgi:hypothetical protein
MRRALRNRDGLTHASLPVMAGLVPAIHALPVRQAVKGTTFGPKTWMAGTSPAMTVGGTEPQPHRSSLFASAARARRGVV